MIDQESMNRLITSGLKSVTGCEVVKSNIANAPIPPYPYISFTIIRTETEKGTYSDANGTRYIPLHQTWSFTIQGNKDNDAQHIALLAKDWLEEAGRIDLNDGGVVVQSVGDISNRDTLLTVGYEFRKGFDVVFSLMNEIQGTASETIDTIEMTRSDE